MSAIVPWIFAAVSLMAGGLSGWMAGRAIGRLNLPGCGSQSGCEALAASRWAKWLGIPVAGPAAALYLLIGIATIAAQTRVELSRSEFFQQGLASAVLLAGAASLWFLFLQLVIVQRACLYCNLVHGLALSLVLMMFFTGFSREPLQAETLQAWLKVPSIWALGGLLLLIAGQVFWRPKTYLVTESAGGLDSASPSQSLEEALPLNGETPLPVETQTTIAASPIVAVSRQVSLLGGRMRLSQEDWPLLGNPGATHLIALLFDYTCPICRAVHQRVQEVIAGQPSELAVLLIPVPQHPACNSHLQKPVPGHGHACQYARLALDVWMRRPDRFEQFDRYLHAEKETPPIGLAMRQAEELTGISLNPHLLDERLDQCIARGVKIFGTLKVPQIPNLLLPRAELAGNVESAAKLRAVLATQLAPAGRG